MLHRSCLAENASISSSQIFLVAAASLATSSGVNGGGSARFHGLCCGGSMLMATRWLASSQDYNCNTKYRFRHDPVVRRFLSSALS
jgi:hypothetical protein